MKNQIVKALLSWFRQHKIKLSLSNNIPSNLPFDSKAFGRKKEGKEISKLTPKQGKTSA